MSGKAVKSAINALDGSVTGTAGAGKTLTALSQTDGKVSATFGDISITKSQVSDFPSTMPPSSHTHGNITNAGDITTNVEIASGDRLVINDESASEVNNSSITFGTSTTTFLSNKGTWVTPPKITITLVYSNSATTQSSITATISNFSTYKFFIVFARETTSASYDSRVLVPGVNGALYAGSRRRNYTFDTSGGKITFNESDSGTGSVLIYRIYGVK